MKPGDLVKPARPLRLNRHAYDKQQPLLLFLHGEGPCNYFLGAGLNNVPAQDVFLDMAVPMIEIASIHDAVGE